MKKTVLVTGGAGFIAHSVATEYLACMASLEALSASSDDPAVRDVAAGNYGNQLTTPRLNEIPRNTSYCNSLRSQSSQK